uniref:Putative reverse transcriptase domain-containing protein n=1 Tax=Tanacetum cinerariifolium TaxID=118510 RepID=A0A6L2MAC9_TANCI|nr:putative reverse transcriptase domain-containing protein [Tanacetum cinerariifolium]
MPPHRNRVNNEANPAFANAVEQAIAALLPTLTTRITEEIRQNKNNRNNGNREMLDVGTLKVGVMMEMHNHRYPCSLGVKAGTQEEAAQNLNWGLNDLILDRIVNTKFIDVEQVANAARNIELCVTGSAGPGPTIWSFLWIIKPEGILGLCLISSCNLYGKCHPRKACHRAIGAWFTCREVGNMAKDCKKGSTSNRGNENNKQPATKIRSANLLPLEMSEFDIILGNWLTEHRATINCHTNRVIFGYLNNPEFIYHGSRPASFILKVSSCRGVRLFVIKRKLCSRFIGPFKIIDRVGEVSFRLALPPKLTHVHNVFHVCLLRGYNYHPFHVISYLLDRIREDLSFFEEPEGILDPQEQVMSQKIIPSLKFFGKITSNVRLLEK